MEGSWLDSIPSHERKKLRRTMSAEAYERLREKVKGPEDLSRELRRNAEVADLHFEMKSDASMEKQMKSAIEKGIREQGIESVLEKPDLTSEQKSALEQGKFSLSVESHPDRHEDAVMVIPEGTVQEKLPVKPKFSESILSQLVQQNGSIKTKENSPKKGVSERKR